MTIKVSVQKRIVHFQQVIRKLKGKYGFKRFFRDGFGTVIEDGNRKYYEAKEVKVRNKIHVLTVYMYTQKFLLFYV